MTSSVSCPSRHLMNGLDIKLTTQDFTFALEGGRTYTIGRDKSCNIQFTSKRLRIHEGTLEVGEWTTTDVS